MDVPEEEVYDVYDGFREIRESALRDAEDDVGQMWDDASWIRSHAKKILSLLPGLQEADDAKVQGPPANSDAEEVFRWIRQYVRTLSWHGQRIGMKTWQLQLKA